MTRTEFEEKSFEDVMSQPNHIIEALQAGYDEDWWDYDCCMGTLDTPIPMTEKADVEHLIDD